VRAGAYGLSLLSVPLNVQVITALVDKPRPLMELRRLIGSPPPSTTRRHLQTLTELGVLERHRSPGFPGSVDFELGEAGVGLLDVVRILDWWLDQAPDGPLQSSSPAAGNAVKALVDGWSAGIIRALAAKPLSLTQLDRLVSTINYPSLERRLTAMRLSGQICACRPSGRSTPYAATSWLRRATGPLAAAAYWERRFLPAETTPISRRDIEAALLLTVPYLVLHEDLSGTVRLVVESANPTGDQDPVGATLQFERGKVRSCVARLEGTAATWVVGSVGSWVAATVKGGGDCLEIGGDTELGRALVDRLYAAGPAAPQRV
jgi:DNA-binding HxlR family transcriptional regulator